MVCTRAQWACGVLFVVSIAGTTAQEQDGQDNAETGRRLETITVTGSYIPGTPEDAALPVNVITARDLAFEGNPSLTDLIKTFGPSSGTDGQTNQFSSNGLEGTTNINLRGLGPARTLVLFNGRRQTFSPYEISEQAQLFVNANIIPSAAIERIEILKDGAAALYGSDAIAGVVNFITRDDLDGLEISGDYTVFSGSDGDYRLSAAYGLQKSSFNWITTLEYQKRAETPLQEKDWAILPLVENPVGGLSSLSNPGRFVVIGPAGKPIGTETDVGCAKVGGIIHPQAQNCRFQFTQFDNLVEEEEHVKLFSAYNQTIGNGNLNLEFLYTTIDVPAWKTSPSYPPQELTTQFVPAAHPGYQRYIADNPASLLAKGVGALYIGRIFGWGGFPGKSGVQEGKRSYQALSAAAAYEGMFTRNIDYSVSLAYSRNEGENITDDTYIAGLTAALRGFGLCTDPATGFDGGTGTQPWAEGYTGSLTAGQNGCEYYNPFSNAIAANAITGAENPDYVASLANSVALADWLNDSVGNKRITDLIVFNALLSGDTGIELPGGPLAFAAGGQIRRERYEVIPNTVSDLTITPGPLGNGPFSFLAGFNPVDEKQTIYALFGELQLPVMDTIDIQLAARYEDYGGSIGSSFDPKLAAKWQVGDRFALRGSVQTAFRGPTLNQLSGILTTLQFIPPASAFKAVDQSGNRELSPETATSFNIGALFEQGGFDASIDYFNFDFSDPIIVEEQESITSAALASITSEVERAASATRTAQATDPNAATIMPDASNLAPIVTRLRFDGGDPFNGEGTIGGNIARINTNIVNGPDIKTSGLDFRATNAWDYGNNTFSLGIEATYIIEYKVSNFVIDGVSITGGNRVGQFNRSNFSRSLPQWKGNITANYAAENHNFRAVIRYIDSYKDERGRANLSGTFSGPAAIIDSHTTLDLFYSGKTRWGFDLGLSMVNVFDQNPPFAAFDLNYDPYTHNPFGRTFKINLTKRFKPS